MMFTADIPVRYPGSPSSTAQAHRRKPDKRHCFERRQGA